MVKSNNETSNSTTGKNVDIEQLADKVYRLMLLELRIDDERQGSTSWGRRLKRRAG